MSCLLNAADLSIGGMRNGFDHKLLPPYRITKEDSLPNVEHKPEDSVPLVADADQPKKGEYGSLENSEPPEAPKCYSEDHLKWHLPATVLPAAELSPFSSP